LLGSGAGVYEFCSLRERGRWFCLCCCDDTLGGEFEDGGVFFFGVVADAGAGGVFGDGAVAGFFVG
jgi:hypothetical protein